MTTINIESVMALAAMMKDLGRVAERDGILPVDIRLGEELAILVTPVLYAYGANGVPYVDLKRLLIDEVWSDLTTYNDLIQIVKESVDPVTSQHLFRIMAMSLVNQYMVLIDELAAITLQPLKASE